jgi:hypothetical protein
MPTKTPASDRAAVLPAVTRIRVHLLLLRKPSLDGSTSSQRRHVAEHSGLNNRERPPKPCGKERGLRITAVSRRRVWSACGADRRAWCSRRARPLWTRGQDDRRASAATPRNAASCSLKRTWCSAIGSGCVFSEAAPGFTSEEAAFSAVAGSPLPAITATDPGARRGSARWRWLKAVVVLASGSETAHTAFLDRDPPASVPVSVPIAPTVNEHPPNPPAKRASHGQHPHNPLRRLQSSSRSG